MAHVLVELARFVVAAQVAIVQFVGIHAIDYTLPAFQIIKTISGPKLYYLQLHPHIIDKSINF